MNLRVLIARTRLYYRLPRIYGGLPPYVILIGARVIPYIKDGKRGSSRLSLNKYTTHECVRRLCEVCLVLYRNVMNALGPCGFTYFVRQLTHRINGPRSFATITSFYLTLMATTAIRLQSSSFLGTRDLIKYLKRCGQGNGINGNGSVHPVLDDRARVPVGDVLHVRISTSRLGVKVGPFLHFPILQVRLISIMIVRIR